MKQVILVRTDLKMSKGKISVQCSHASVEAVLKSDKQIIVLAIKAHGLNGLSGEGFWRDLNWSRQLALQKITE